MSVTELGWEAIITEASKWIPGDNKNKFILTFHTYEPNISNECICIQVFSQGSDGESASVCLGKCTKQMPIKPGVLHTAACIYVCVRNPSVGLEEICRWLLHFLHWFWSEICAESINTFNKQTCVKDVQNFLNVGCFNFPEICGTAPGCRNAQLKACCLVKKAFRRVW